MHTETAQRTLLEDWRARRERLGTRLDRPGEVAELQIRILDYLIDRYADAPEAARPARSSPKPDLYVDWRAIVVHHYVWQGRVSGVKTSGAAQSRVASILQRMASPEKDDSDRTDVDPADFMEDELVPRHLRRAIDRAVWWNQGGRLKSLIEAALGEGPYLPNRALSYLYRRISNTRIADLDAAKLLTRCGNACVGRLAALAWSERFDAGICDDVQEALTDYLRHSEEYELLIEKTRLGLANDAAAVRLHAAEILAELGNLDDIGLLSDLLAMPPQADEDPDERSALIRAMRRIARR